MIGITTHAACGKTGHIVPSGVGVPGVNRPLQFISKLPACERAVTSGDPSSPQTGWYFRRRLHCLLSHTLEKLDKASDRALVSGHSSPVRIIKL